MSLTDWSDGSDPYAATAALLDPRGSYAISDPAWAMHLLGLQQGLAESRYVSMTSTLPILRAVKDAEELERLAAAGAAADATFEQFLGVRFAGRRERDIGADLAGLLRDHGHSEVDFTVVGSGPNGATTRSASGRSRKGACQEIDRVARRVITDAGRRLNNTSHDLRIVS